MIRDVSILMNAI